MKQHMLTHKIRDMPQHMFGSPTASVSSDKSGRRSADYQDQEKSQGSNANSSGNNNSQREKNHNAEARFKTESGMKRPSSTDVDDSQVHKRPLSEYLANLIHFSCSTFSPTYGPFICLSFYLFLFICNPCPTNPNQSSSMNIPWVAVSESQTKSNLY